MTLPSGNVRRFVCPDEVQGKGVAGESHGGAGQSALGNTFKSLNAGMDTRDF